MNIKDIATNILHEAKKEFDNPNREGAKNLEKNGYVEYNEFKDDVLRQMKDGKVSGYFCITCSAYEKKEDTIKGGWCKALKGEDAFYGCCNVWKYSQYKVKEVMKG